MAGPRDRCEVLDRGVAVRVQFAGGSDQCRYDADGQMIKPCDNWSTFLAYDGANVVGRPGLANDGRATFVHGPGLDDPLLGMVRFQSDAKELTWVTDGGGRQYAVGGIDGHDPASIAPNIDFSGQSGYWGWQWVGGTKRSYGFSAGRQTPAGSAGAFSVFRNRLYDPATGRWTQEDPIGVAGGVNLYQFNGNDPITNTDPFGLCTKEERGNATQSQVCNSDILRSRIKNGTGPKTSGNKITEAGVAGGNPVEVPAALLATRIAGALAPALARQYAPHDEANATEAARHQIWQCVLATGISQDYARELGNAHEFGQSWTPDSRRDQHNNAAGRGLAENGQNCRQGVIDNLRTHRYPRVEDYD